MPKCPSNNLPKFRIRWAIVITLGPNADRRERLCIAQVRNHFLWFDVWWNLPDACWRATEDDALRDIEHYRRIHQPLPETRYIE